MVSTELVNGYVCTISDNNIHIKDSYRVFDKSEMKEMLYTIWTKRPDCNVFKRSYDSMIAEWRAHNLAYRWGIEKDRTKDVDINYPLKWYVELIYKIFGI